LLHDALIAAGVPDVRAVWAHEIGGARMFNVVAIQQRYAGHARQAGHILSQCGVGAYMSALLGGSRRGHRPRQPAGGDVGGGDAHRSGDRTSTSIERGMGSKNDPMFVAYRYDAPFSSKR